jgi:hypothetical protein
MWPLLEKHTWRLDIRYWRLEIGISNTNIQSPEWRNNDRGNCV